MKRRRFGRVYRPIKPAGRAGGTRAELAQSKQVAREEPVCWLRLPGCTIRSTTGDHYYPVKTHPHLRMVRSNRRGSCHHCNVTRGATPPHLIEQLRAQLIAKNRPPPALGFFG